MQQPIAAFAHDIRRDDINEQMGSTSKAWTADVSRAIAL